MNPLEAQLDYPHGDALPDAGAVMELAPGVFWLRMGLPFALNHINLWLLRDAFDNGTGKRDGWTVIDCGIDSEATRAAWETVFTEHLQGLPILRVIATHCHPDHVGLAHWLCERWDARLWMTAGEYAFARMMSAQLPGADGTAMFPHFQKHGLQDTDSLKKLQTRKHYYATMVPSVPEAYRRMQDGEAVRIGGRAWQVITGFGHSPEHAALHCEEIGLLISGDMLLPRISTNVSVFAIEPEADPVKLYLDSLEKFSALASETMVLPSHGKPFRRLHVRIDQLRAHHAERLAEVLAVCTTPQSAVDIVPVMFKRPLDGHQLSFAIGEALAHLHTLWYEGKLARRLHEDGVIRFTLAATARSLANPTTP
jgi:glyoxylase-like metal-dependent hydrolase (beta-lactamase superfamily II)